MPPLDEHEVRWEGVHSCGSTFVESSSVVVVVACTSKEGRGRRVNSGVQPCVRLLDCVSSPYWAEPSELLQELCVDVNCKISCSTLCA